MANPEPYSRFRYSVVRAWELDVEQLLAGGVGTLPLAPLTDAAAPPVPMSLPGSTSLGDFSDSI